MLESQLNSYQTLDESTATSIFSTSKCIFSATSLPGPKIAKTVGFIEEMTLDVSQVYILKKAIIYCKR